MYCPNCRNEMTDQGAESVCAYCNTRINKSQVNPAQPYQQYPNQQQHSNQQQYSQQPANNDSSSIGYGLLGYFFPIVGLILYLVWKDEYPLRAKSAGKGALISVIVNAILTIIIIIIAFVIAGSSINTIDTSSKILTSMFGLV